MARLTVKSNLVSLHKSNWFPATDEQIWEIEINLVWNILQETYSEFCQTSSLTIFAKNSILDVWQGSEYASDYNERTNRSSQNSPETLRKKAPSYVFYSEFWEMFEAFITFFL